MQFNELILLAIILGIAFWIAKSWVWWIKHRNDPFDIAADARGVPIDNGSDITVQNSPARLLPTYGQAGAVALIGATILVFPYVFGGQIRVVRLIEAAIGASTVQILSVLFIAIGVLLAVVRAVVTDARLESK